MENNQLAQVTQLAQMNHLDVAKTIINGIKSGDLEPVRLHMFLKRVEELSKTVLKDEDAKRIILEDAESRIEKGSSFKYMGATLTVQAVSTQYDFSSCNDPMWESLAEVEKQVKEMKKGREDYLKAAFPEPKAGALFGSVSPKIIVDHTYCLSQMDCGEEVTLGKPIKYQKRGIKTSFDK